MQLIEGKIVFGKKDCHCGDGTMSTRTRCPECNGTGKGKRGGARGCKKCSGNGTYYDHDKPSVCSTCNGVFKDHQQENDCDYLPADIVTAVPLKVYYTNKMTLGESLLGLGCVFSVGDYGGAWKHRNDEKLIADVKGHAKHVQATKLINNENMLCDHIGVFVSEQGYTVKPVFVTPAVVV